ncbi:hypothetical protein [Aminobacter ciceronei]|uniref:Uncharacterized protein n=1 Tax=Aminobacter ciceronei TaxID=150723 RepID=A0ABR6C9G5_9HYPH|nr:hypothetical protein [Aminobacter ciceronei]MBA8907890.1 hypothetical protein [Aminobacter ciceronei]MBA9021662.1 hypothetical protein [Aminobacter ciceronei]
MTTATTETYLDDTAYRILVEHLTHILRRYKKSLFNPNPAEDAAGLKMHLLAALRTSNIDTGDLVLGAGGVTGTKRQELVEALADIEPDSGTAAYEPDGVKRVLGETGNIWPASIREDVA